jgi:hypothetical protein
MEDHSIKSSSSGIMSSSVEIFVNLQNQQPISSYHLEKDAERYSGMPQSLHDAIAAVSA